MPEKSSNHEKNIQERISLLLDALLSSNSNVTDLDLEYPPSAIRVFIRHADHSELTGILMDVLVALENLKKSTDKPK